jgi:hypothetical protein
VARSIVRLFRAQNQIGAARSRPEGSSKCSLRFVAISHLGGQSTVLINTGASARWNGAAARSELFQQFGASDGKLLKQLALGTRKCHRADAPVLIASLRFVGSPDENLFTGLFSLERGIATTNHTSLQTPRQAQPPSMNQKLSRFNPIAVASFFCRASVLMNSLTPRILAAAQCRTSSERQPSNPVCCSASLAAS